MNRNQTLDYLHLKRFKRLMRSRVDKIGLHKLCNVEELKRALFGN
jgi:hypothetical protein